MRNILEVLAFCITCGKYTVYSLVNSSRLRWRRIKLRGPTKAERADIGSFVYYISNHFTAISSETVVPYPRST